MALGIAAMTTLVVTYRESSGRLMAQAHEELEAGDLCQASEKAWGAAAQVVKAAAAMRGWEHDQHRYLWIAARELSNEAGNQEIHDLFGAAHNLHVNFYENTFDADRVSLYISRVKRLIGKLEVLLDG